MLTSPTGRRSNSSNSSNSSKKRIDAFTLIELTLVISIIVIMVGLAVPSLKSFAESSRLKSSALSLKSLLLYARDLSITEKSGYLVIFDLANNRYWLTKPELIQSGDLESSIYNSTSASASNLTTGNRDGRSQNSPLPLRASMVLGIAKAPAKGVKIIQTSTPRNLQNSVGLDYVLFEANGQGEEAIIYLQNNSESLAVEVDETTGRISVYQPEKTDEAMGR